MPDQPRLPFCTVVAAALCTLVLAACTEMPRRTTYVTSTTAQNIDPKQASIPVGSNGHVYFPGTLVAQGDARQLASNSHQAGYRNLAATAQPSYRLGNGDRLRITVFGEAGLTGQYLVDGSGYISMPLVSQVRIGGLTTAQAQSVITEKLRQGYLRSPDVAVQVVTYRPFFILGEVQRSGQYPYVAGMTVETAVAIAGGFSPRARKSKFKVLRQSADGPEKLLLKPTAKVMPGDTITVAERYF